MNVAHGASLRVANLLAFPIVLTLNALAGSGALSGRSIGEIANAYPTYFLPADYVFGIWSIIYAGLAAFVVYQARPGWRDGEAVRRLGTGWLANAALNVAWLSAFSFGRYLTAWLLMIALLGNLVWIHERIGIGRSPLSLRDRLLVATPFSIYLAWISVALIANTSQLVAVVGWNGFGIDGRVWAALMITVGTGLSATMAARRSSWAFPLVFAWAFIGIAVRYPDAVLVRSVAWIGAIVGVAFRGALAARRFSADDWPGASTSA